MFDNMSEHIANVIRAHAEYPCTPAHAYRRFDGKTPYPVHPIWCATTLATEAALPIEVRELGFLTLLYHDVVEDTTMPLPNSLSDEVKKAIQDMTFENTADEMERIWDFDPKIRLFKLYDKTNNLINLDGWDAKKIAKYSNYTAKLSSDVLDNFGTLNVHWIFWGIKEKYTPIK